MTNVLCYLQWFKNKNPQTLIRKREEPGGSLYTWFSDLTICFGESAVLIGWGKWNISVASTAIFISTAPAAAKSLQSCPTLCDPRDGSPPGSPVPGILQARTLEWVAISFSTAWKWKVKVKVKSCPTLCNPMDCSPPDSSLHGILQATILEWVAIPFSRGSSWPGIEPRSPVLQADSSLSEPRG